MKTDTLFYTGLATHFTQVKFYTYCTCKRCRHIPRYVKMFSYISCEGGKKSLRQIHRKNFSKTNNEIMCCDDTIDELITY